MLQLNLQAIGAAAVLYPSIYAEGPRIAKAENSIDGLSHVGETGATGATFCASTNNGWSANQLQYLRVDLKSAYFVWEVRLFLRDDEKRQMWQNGLNVVASNGSVLSQAVRCGNAYSIQEGGQHPAFTCNQTVRYIWMVGCQFKCVKLRYLQV